MTLLRRIARRLRSLLHRRRLEEDMAEEMRFHLEERAADIAADGVSNQEARDAAHRRFGNVTCIQEQAREIRGWTLLEDFLNDLRFSVRQFRKARGFTVVAVATLAIGIGATTAIYSAIDAVLLRPQPYPEPERLVNVFEALPSGGRNLVSGASFVDWREHQSSFEALCLYAYDEFDLTGLGEPEKISALSVTSEFNRVLGIAPILGRGFMPGDDQVGGQNHVVMISERFWRTRFGASPAVLNRSLQIDGAWHLIIGVMPDRAWFLDTVSIFVPYALWPDSYRMSHDVHRHFVLGRLAPGASPAHAQARLNAIKQGLNSSYPVFKQNWGVLVQPTQEFLAARSKPVLLLLFAAVGLVLLISCANVANLLLARATTRQREIAMRAALGASNARLFRQVVTESLLLSFLGGAGGTVLAMVAIVLLRSVSHRLLPSTMVPQMDLRVLAFSLLATGGIGILFGMVPAIRMRVRDLARAIGNGGRGFSDGGHARVQSALVVGEVALTAVLLIGTGLLVRGLVQATSVDPGINPRNVLMFGMTMPFNDRYQGEVARMAFLDQALEEVAAVPGVVSAATTDDLPFSDGGQGYFYSLEERPETRQDRAGAIKYVSPGYFDTLGARLVRGRPIVADDNRMNAPRVLVVNQHLVDELFGEENPLGRRLNVNNLSWEIVGVVSDMRVDGLPTRPRPTFYAAQHHFPWGSAFLVRTQGVPLAVAGSVAAAIHRLDSGLPLANVRTLESAMEASLGPQRLVRNLIGAFAVAALVLASIGLYGVMAYTVSVRRRETSIRLALGATRTGVVWQFVARGLRLMSLGLVIGFAVALTAALTLAHWLHGMSAHDTLAFASAGAVLFIVTITACYVPARQSAKIDALRALDAE